MDTDTDYLVATSTYLQQSEVRSYDSLVIPPPTRTENRPQKLPQYVAAISASLCAFAAGIILGWTSPIKTQLMKGQFHGIPVNDNEMGWIGSLVNIGAMIGCLPTGYICDKIGRKLALVTLVLPLSVGWTLVLTATNVYMLYAGRFVMGLAVGSCCVSVPMYISEIAHKNERGRLASYFQILITFGIFFSYVVGALCTIDTFLYTCFFLSLVYGVLLILQPKSPLFNLKRGNYEKAKEGLQQLRGKNYNVEEELALMELTLQEVNAHINIFTALRRRACYRSVIITLVLMFFQQFSGINTVIFYTSDIFEEAKVELNAHYCSMIVGGTQVLAAYSSSLVVDRGGRRLLLILSAMVMSLSMILLASYFIFQRNQLVSDETLKSLGFLPVILLVVYIVAFSFGFGPVPWILCGELFAPEIKAVAGPAAGAVSWFLSFLITRWYLQLDRKFGDDGVFYIFGVILIFAAVYSFFSVPETKNRTLAEIQDDLQNY